MIYYMIFLTNGDRFQEKQVQPVYNGREIFLSESKARAEEHINLCHLDFPEAKYKIVSVEV